MDAILLLCLALNAVSLLLFHYLLKDLSGEMAELRTLARRAHLQRMREMEDLLK